MGKAKNKRVIYMNKSSLSIEKKVIENNEPTKTEEVVGGKILPGLTIKGNIELPKEYSNSFSETQEEKDARAEHLQEIKKFEEKRKKERIKNAKISQEKWTKLGLGLPPVEIDKRFKYPYPEIETDIMKLDLK
ncbi:MAG: hypothetical protein OEX08_03680 [Candidatus Nomurabacteria bacterium]|nr:hypothetical protein [Candidatus Nomurabacteria bacterium]